MSFHTASHLLASSQIPLEVRQRNSDWLCYFGIQMHPGFHGCGIWRMDFSKVWMTLQLLLASFLQTRILSHSQNRSCKSAQNRITAAPQSAGSYQEAWQTKNKWLICLCLKEKNGSKSVTTSLFDFYPAAPTQNDQVNPNPQEWNPYPYEKAIGRWKSKSGIGNRIIFKYVWGLVGNLEALLFKGTQTLCLIFLHSFSVLGYSFS